MLSVGLSEEAVQPYLEQLSSDFGSHGITVGYINSPKNMTVTGSEPQVDKLKSLLETDSIFARKLLVTVAYHSSQMEEIAAEYLGSIEHLERGDASNTNTIMISSVSCSIVSLDELQQSNYWVKNMTMPVRFSDALAQMCSISAKYKDLADVNELLEVGPHSAMQGPTKDILNGGKRKDISDDSVMVRYVSALDTLLDAIGRLVCSGYPVDVSEVNRSGMKFGAHMV